MAAKHDSLQRKTSPFEVALTVSLWAWMSLNAVLAIWLNSRLQPVIVWAVPPIALGLLCAWIHFGRSILLDIQPGYQSDPVRGVYNHAWLIGDEATIDVAVQAQIDRLIEIQRVKEESGP